MITLPPELMEQIKFYCNNNDLGMSSMSTDLVNVLVIGNNSIHPNTVHLVVAHMMISGVLTNEWSNANDEAEKEHEQEKERKPF